MTPRPDTTNDQALPVGGRERLSRDFILDVAVHEFAAKGYRGASLGDVADALGVTRQALYYWFAKKHDILHALFLRFFERLDEAASRAEAETEDPSARFGAMLRAHIMIVAEEPSLSSLFTEERVNLPPSAEADVQERRRLYHSRFVAAYQAGIDAGEHREDVSASLAVSILLGAANWVYRWYHPDGSITPERLSAVVDGLLATGYAVEPVTATRRRRRKAKVRARL